MSRSTNYFGTQTARGRENVCSPAIRIKFSKKLGMFVKTWFTIERDKGGNLFFKQNNAFHKDAKAEARFWTPKPFGNVMEAES